VPSPYNLPEDIKPMMDEQRAIQATLPESERIFIGGEIQIHHLTRDGFRVFTHAEFDDFALDKEAVLNRF